MKRIIALLALLVSQLGIAGQSTWPQEPVCVTTVTNTVVCPLYPGGGLAVDNIGRVVCGKGQCVTNAIGQVYCSRRPGGYAALDSINQPVCSGGCEPASYQYCEVLRK